MTEINGPALQGSDIKLRPVQPEDDPFLLEVYASTRAEEMALVPWTDEQRQAFLKMQFDAQQNYYQQKYPTADHDIIHLHETPLGRLYVARLEEEVRIVDITLLPQHRGRGIGTHLLTELMNEATNKRLPLRIYVETFNPSLKLFERLGFTQTAQHGMHLLMQWPPGIPLVSD